MTKKRIVKEYFSEARVELMQEVKRHPDLIAMMAEAEVKEWSEQLGMIAAHCSIVMDGHYMQEELEAIYPLLIHELRRKNQIIIH